MSSATESRDSNQKSKVTIQIELFLASRHANCACDRLSVKKFNQAVNVSPEPEVNGESVEELLKQSPGESKMWIPKCRFKIQCSPHYVNLINSQLNCLFERSWQISLRFSSSRMAGANRPDCAELSL